MGNERMAKNLQALPPHAINRYVEIEKNLQNDLETLAYGMRTQCEALAELLGCDMKELDFARVNKMCGVLSTFEVMTKHLEMLNFEKSRWVYSVEFPNASCRKL